MLESVKKVIIDLQFKIDDNYDAISELEYCIAERDELGEDEETWGDDDYEEAEQKLGFLKHDAELMVNALRTLIDTYDLYRWYYEEYCEPKF